MKKILILCLLSLSFSQEFDYSKMSDTDKILMYNSMKKSPVAAGFLELIPTAGYAYAGKIDTRAILIGTTKTSLSVAGLTIILQPNSEWGIPGVMLLVSSIISVYSIYDVVNQTSQYNSNLYKQIFGEEPPKIGMNLYPLHDGAGITLTYSFN